MGFKHGTVEAQQRRSPMGIGIQAAFDRAEGVLRQQPPQLAMGTGGQLAFDHGEYAGRQALAGFQVDVPYKPVTDDDLDAAFEQVVSFDIADEVEVELFAEFEGFAGQFVAFRVFGADAEYADARIFVTEDVS